VFFVGEVQDGMPSTVIARGCTGDRPCDKFTAVPDMLAAVAAARSVPWRRRLLGILGVDA
jgi:hypothetical protein